MAIDRFFRIVLGIISIRQMAFRQNFTISGLDNPRDCATRLRYAFYRNVRVVSRYNTRTVRRFVCNGRIDTTRIPIHLFNGREGVGGLSGLTVRRLCYYFFLTIKSVITNVGRVNHF